jgi:hypothetical protein
MATLTTVLSMKAMLEARIVAASIQILASALQGTSAPADRIMASSQGVFMKAIVLHFIVSVPANSRDTS